MKTRTLGHLAFAAAVFMTVAAFAADHREAPRLRNDPAADIGDIYAFRDPNDSTSLVLVMTVNPFSAPTVNATYRFAPDVLYRFNVDNTGDARAEHTVDIVFSDSPSPGAQTFQARFPDAVTVSGTATAPTNEPAPNEPMIAEGPDGIRVFAGQRDDPFFFDGVGFGRFLAGTGGFSGDDRFSGFNVSAIVVRLPLASVTDGSNTLQIWAETQRRRVTLRRVQGTSVERGEGAFTQVDRTGNPGVEPNLIPLSSRDLFNAALPENDVTDFAPVVIESLTALGTSEANIGILAQLAVPNTIKLDLTAADGFPNGRRLHDDVIDILLSLILNDPEASDGADDNDRAFLDSFPFLAPPFQP